MDYRTLNHLVMRKKVFKFFGQSFKFFDSDNNLCFYVKQKAFKLREDIRIYSDDSMTQELILIRARNIVDFSAVYDVYDSITNEHIGAFKRKGMKSIIKDEWLIFDVNDCEAGIIKEDSTALAIVRRFLTNLIPQTFEGFYNGSEVFEFKQRFNPFVFKMDIDFSEGVMFDRRLGISAAVLLGAIEGRQN